MWGGAIFENGHIAADQVYLYKFITNMSASLAGGGGKLQEQCILFCETLQTNFLLLQKTIGQKTFRNYKFFKHYKLSKRKTITFSGFYFIIVF